MPENTNRSSLQLPPDVSSEILQKVQEGSAVMRLARRIPLPGNGVMIPVITGDPEAEWVGETDNKPVSHPQLGTKKMQAYKLAVIEPFSNEFRRDANALYTALVGRLPNVLATKFDKTTLGVVNKPGDNFDNFAACTAQSILPANNGTYLGLVAADTDIALHGGLLNGFAMGAQARGILLSATDGTGRPLFLASASEGAVDKILGQPSHFNRGIYKPGTAAVAATQDTEAVAAAPAIVGIAGDWTKALYGTVEGVKVDISDQATLTYTDENNQTVTLNLWQRNMFAVRAEIEIGFRADLDCFNLLTGVTPT